MTKTVALSDEAYESLSNAKENDESFSKVVLRMTNNGKRSLKDFFGIWKDDKESDTIYKQIISQRSGHKPREVRL